MACCKSPLVTFIDEDVCKMYRSKDSSTSPSARHPAPVSLFLPVPCSPAWLEGPKDSTLVETLPVRTNLPPDALLSVNEHRWSNSTPFSDCHSASLMSPLCHSCVTTESLPGVSPMQGSNILLDNTDDIAKLACQFGTDRLNKVLTQVLTYLAKQHPDTLANLPTFANILSGLDSQTLNVSVCERNSVRVVADHID